MTEYSFFLLAGFLVMVYSRSKKFYKEGKEVFVMDKKGVISKIFGKIGSGVLFVISCFVAMYVLTEFHGNIVLVIIAAILLLISAFLFLNAMFTDMDKEWAPEPEVPDTSSNGDGEFRMKLTKHMKEMENSQKELVEALKSQNALLHARMERLEHEIHVLSEHQVNQTKSVIKFNKENARQLAISERETLEHVMLELKQSIEENVGKISVQAAAPAEPAYISFEQPVEEVSAPVLEEVTGEDLFEVSDFPGDEEFVMLELPPAPEPEPVAEAVPEIIPEPEPVVMPEPEVIPEIEPEVIPEPEVLPEAVEEIVIPEMPADIEIPTPEDIIPEIVPEIIPEVVPEPEPQPEADPLAGIGSSDPGAMMSPEDIAKLLEAMGN